MVYITHTVSYSTVSARYYMSGGWWGGILNSAGPQHIIKGQFGLHRAVQVIKVVLWH